MKFEGGGAAAGQPVERAQPLDEVRMRRHMESRRKHEDLYLAKSEASMDTQGKIEYEKRVLGEADQEARARKLLNEENPWRKELEEAVLDALYVVRKLNVRDGNAGGTKKLIEGESRTRMVDAARELGNRMLQLAEKNKLTERIKNLARGIIEAADYVDEHSGLDTGKRIVMKDGKEVEQWVNLRIEDWLDGERRALQEWVDEAVNELPENVALMQEAREEIRAELQKSGRDPGDREIEYMLPKKYRQKRNEYFRENY